MIDSLRHKRIMVVVAHPDDEILGLAGTMHRLISMYRSIVHVIILGEGITSRSKERDRKLWEGELQIHRQNIHTAQEAVGYQSVSIYDFPDNRFDSIALLDLIKVVEKEKKQFKPDVIFTHHGGDLNVDHQRTFEAVMTACRPMKDELVKTIITFETMSGTEWRASSDPKTFLPNLFVEITEEGLDVKCQAMESYEFERRVFPHPRSPEALKIRAQMWGVANGVSLAEAFQVIRSIGAL